MGNNSSKPLALIIEDDDKLSTIFSQAIKLADFDTISAMNGQNAIEILKSTQPALILLDLHLPNISGDKILAHIRQDKQLKETQVILTTADPLMADMLLEQSDYVLQKPISFGQLRDLAARIRSTFN